MTEYKRIGQCIQCGDCCYTMGVKCPHLQQVGNKTFCDIYPFRLDICKSYPMVKDANNPNTPKCGYKYD